MSRVPLIDHNIPRAIDEAEESEGTKVPSGFLGGSIIGTPCSRRLWYTHRQAYPRRDQVSGRMLRLFKTGHRQEAVVVEGLRKAGFTVSEVAEDGEQWGSKAINGHLALRLDGLVTMDDGGTAALEIKTHNKRSFSDLVKHGVVSSKPQHAAQMQIGMCLMGLDWALYVAICKDDECLYAEWLEHDPEQSDRLLSKAERIIYSDEAPHRISESIDSPMCRMCPYRDPCHIGGPAARNCRTCLHSQPSDDGQWYCNFHEKTLTREEERAGCQHHLYLPSFVKGEVVEASQEDNYVVYRMTDSARRWKDRGDNSEYLDEAQAHGGGEPG